MKIGQLQITPGVKFREVKGSFQAGQYFPVTVHVSGKIGISSGHLTLKGPVTSSKIILDGKLNPINIFTIRNDKTIGEVICGNTEILNDGNTLSSRCLGANSSRDLVGLGLAINKVASDHLGWYSELATHLKT